MATEEMTDEQKIRKLAGWSSRYRNGLKEMIEAGFDLDELDASIDEAEKQLAAEQKERQRMARIRQSLRRF